MSDGAEQKAEWEAYVAKAHAKGLCEFSGLRATKCQRTICDCFETPEGAAEIERKAVTCSECDHASKEHRAPEGQPWSCRACVAEGAECPALVKP